MLTDGHKGGNFGWAVHPFCFRYRSGDFFLTYMFFILKSNSRRIISVTYLVAPKELRVERPFVHQSFFWTVCNSIQFWTPIWCQEHSHQEVPRVHLSSWDGVMRPQHHMIVSTVYFLLISRYLNRNQCRSTAVFRRSTTKFHICCFNITLHEPAQSYTSMKSHLASQPQFALLCSQRTYKHRSRGLIIN